jgi:hypothetical protein
MHYALLWALGTLINNPYKKPFPLELRGRGGQGGEMTQTMYAHVNK